MSSTELLEHIVRQDLLGQLVRREGRMAELCTEAGQLRMDWVDSVADLVADPSPLTDLEELAAGWRERGIRHVIWSGMGGSSVAVRMLTDLGFCDGSRGGIRVHPLDSTDPAALDTVLTAISAPMCQVVMVAVSLGASSEEPGTHLTWFLERLDANGLRGLDHALVLTVPGSRLAEVAGAHALPVRPVHLVGSGGFPGRMSAPASAVFLLPLALHHAGSRGRLHDMVAAAWSIHDLELAVREPARSPYVRLAADLAAHTRSGRSRLMLDLPIALAPLHTWIEQLLEQTLAKDGKGIVVLRPQRRQTAMVVAGGGSADLAIPTMGDGDDPLASLAAVLLGWQLTVALLGCLAGTNIVDEPAVETYKALARSLRGTSGLLTAAVERGAIDWTATGASGVDPLAQRLAAAAGARELSYLDLTVNGELPDAVAREVAAALHAVGNDVLGVPVKLRRAPAAYHVSEQCQMDGPAGLVSLRVVARGAQGRSGVSHDFLHAQAVATWRAMTEAGRDCLLVVVDELPQTAAVIAALTEAVRTALTPATSGLPA